MSTSRKYHAVIDEAHCMTDWGNSFRPDYANLGSLRSLLHGCAVYRAATMNPQQNQTIARTLQFTDNKTVYIHLTINRSNLFLGVKCMGKGGDTSYVSSRLISFQFN